MVNVSSYIARVNKFQLSLLYYYMAYSIEKNVCKYIKKDREIYLRYATCS